MDVRCCRGSRRNHHRRSDRPLASAPAHFSLSMGDAIEAPTWRAILPEVVKKEDLSAALALNGIEFNLARAVCPGLAGLIIAALGVATAFTLNALSFLGVILVIARWKRPARNSKLP